MLSINPLHEKSSLPLDRGADCVSRFGGTEPGSAFVHLILGAWLENRFCDFLQGVLLG